MEQPHSWKYILQINTNLWSLSTAQPQCERTFSLQSKPSFLQASNLVALCDYFCTQSLCKRKTFHKKKKKAELLNICMCCIFWFFTRTLWSCVVSVLKFKWMRWKSSYLKGSYTKTSNQTFCQNSTSSKILQTVLVKHLKGAWKVLYTQLTQYGTCLLTIKHMVYAG